MCFCTRGKKKMVSSLRSAAEQSETDGRRITGAAEDETRIRRTLKCVIKTSAHSKNLKVHCFPHWFTLSSMLAGQGVERHPLRRYPACEWVPWGSQEGLKCGKRGLDIFHGTILWKCRSALRGIPSIGWGSHKRGDVRRNHAWLNTKSTQRNEI